MSATRRSILAAAGAGVAMAPIVKSTNALAEAAGGTVTDEIVAELVRRSAEGNSALMRGDIDGYRALIPHTDNYTLMSPFGGTPTRAART